MQNQQDGQPQGQTVQGQDQSDTSDRGFAAMNEDTQRDIAGEGGQSVPDEERSFSQDRELAAEAGRKGGEASQGQAAAGEGSDEPRTAEADEGQAGGEASGATGQALEGGPNAGGL